MHRKEFIKTVGILAVGTIGGSFLNSCAAIKYVQYSVEGNNLVVKKSEFSDLPKFVLLSVNGLPAAIYLRKNETDTFTALLTQCTHKGCEVDPDYDMLLCPCHGSKYSSEGAVISPPAKDPLMKFNVSTDQDNIYIHLKGG
jgi:cytochrome b6-f complex iron-sulfur subunit